MTPKMRRHLRDLQHDTAAEQAMANRPFPALTPTQRLHLDVFGYIVVEDTLTAAEVAEALEAMLSLRQELIELQATTHAAHKAPGITPPESGAAKVRGCWMTDAAANPAAQHFMHIVESDPAILKYLAHPRMVAMAEELVGGPVRLEESEASINRMDHAAVAGDPARRGSVVPRGFHQGAVAEIDSYQRHGLGHCGFVKTLTCLTDLRHGPLSTLMLRSFSHRHRHQIHHSCNLLHGGRGWRHGGNTWVAQARP